MNILRELNKPTKIIQQFRSLSSGHVDLITDIFLTPGQQSIRRLNKLDTGNAEVNILNERF